MKKILSIIGLALILIGSISGLVIISQINTKIYKIEIDGKKYLSTNLSKKTNSIYFTEYTTGKKITLYGNIIIEEYNRK